MVGLLGRARRAAAPGRGRVRRHHDRRAWQRDHHRRRRRRAGRPGSSRSSSSCSSAARGSTPRRSTAPSTWCRRRAALRGARPPRCCARPAAGRCARRPPARSATSTRSRPTRSPSASGRPAPASPTSPWRWRCRPCRPSRSNRIILTRPAVEAGERLGFLPGDLMAKVDPYLRPLYDALYDMLEPEGTQRLLDRGHDRGRAARLHARPHAERQLRHPRRGAEHHARADEDVPHPHRLRLEGGRDRRRHPDRRAGRPLGARRARADARRRRGPRLRPPRPGRRRPPPDRAGHRVGLRAAGPPAPTGRRRERRCRSRSSSPTSSRTIRSTPTRWSALARGGACAPRASRGDAELSVLFVDEAAIAALNERFLGQKGPTDVLAFPIEDEPDRGGRSPDEGGTGPDCEPPETAGSRCCSVTSSSARRSPARNAPEHAGTYDDEIALLVVHGILHLLGMDHEDDDGGRARWRHASRSCSTATTGASTRRAGHGAAPRPPSVPGRRRRPDRRRRRAARRVGAPRPRRDQPRPDEPGDGAGARGRRAPRRAVARPPGRGPRALPQPGAAAGARSASSSSPPSSASSPRTCSARWGVVVATVFEIVVIFVARRGGPEELGRAATRPRRAVHRAARLRARRASRRSG